MFYKFLLCYNERNTIDIPKVIMVETCVMVILKVIIYRILGNIFRVRRDKKEKEEDN